MACKVIVLTALVAATLASPVPSPANIYGHSGPVVPVPVAPPAYNFNYAVKDYNGNEFGHQETRDGYNTQGAYYVQLPDSRLQKVDYYVIGDSGYVAQVSYQGQAQYPAYQPAPAPFYRPAPAPSYQPSPSYS